ncbi:uncharacterized protein F4822DRAFT_391092 [Hypoxylon trugodes]|uniref:uncharacterized protein n=1 Tax=Hypoxylon trugodes TaxID=326681 RepID=UPI00219916B0|nr:uncharacterized protein F4822DRAFT_391092 [Hypoxylon trugodes]KAI1392447.1 hypothetical protein F4822DRAFT_391092 [Hypoxylon trugodes]
MLNLTSTAILRPWHKLLNLPRQSPPSWYHDRLREELIEREEAGTPLEKLSETADVFFAISRATYDGYPVREMPRFRYSHVPVYAYMLAKYTSRWAFYRAFAFLCDAPDCRAVREVVNPTKDHKLDQVSERDNINSDKFRRLGRWLRRVWPLFP